MIINSSRAAEFLLCRRKAFNRVHRNLTGPRSFSLIDGAAMHRGIAYGLAKKDWLRAVEVAREGFEEDKKRIQALPEEEAYIFNNHWTLVEKLISVYAENFSESEFQVIQPECEFDVVLPATHHNCVWLHWYHKSEKEWHWGTPSAEAILAKQVVPCDLGSDCQCWQPHRLVGRTDALVLWNRALWLFEHKSSSIEGEQFWAQFRLALQPTIYIYGIWKHLGLKPNGVLVNLITKPTENQVAAYNQKRKYGEAKGVVDYVKYSREAFLRSDADLERVETQMINLCNEWEERIISGSWPLSNIPQICVQYNSLCHFHGMCCSHDSPADIESLEHGDDNYYVDVKLRQLLPSVIKEVHI